MAFAWSGLFVACLCSRGGGEGGGGGVVAPALVKVYDQLLCMMYSHA